MRGAYQRLTARILAATVGAAIVIAAFLRGNDLLGVPYGITYAAVMLAMLRLLVRARMANGRVAMARLVLQVPATLWVGYAMAFPVTLNQEMQSAIERHAIDRNAQAELAAVLSSDTRYRKLSVALTHRYDTHLTILGTLGSRSELKQLRTQIGRNSLALSKCVLHWNVFVQDNNDRASRLDENVFWRSSDQRKRTLKGPYQRSIGIESSHAETVLFSRRWRFAWNGAD